MRLIDVDAAIDCIKSGIKEDGNFGSDAIHLIEFLNVFARSNKVAALPLDKLCKFLEKCGADSYCGTCKQIMGGCFTDGNGCGSEHFWKELLIKWMETDNE